MPRLKFSEHTHGEQTFLTQIGSVKSRLKTEAELGIGTTAARIRLEENEFSNSGERGSKAGVNEPNGNNLKTWERGEVSLSSERLRHIFDVAFGATPANAPVTPLPKSDYMMQQRAIEMVKELRKRQSTSRDQLVAAAEDFIRSTNIEPGSNPKRRKRKSPPWDIPTMPGDNPLINGTRAIKFFRDFYRCNQLPESLTIPDIEALIAVVEAHFRSTP